MQRLFDPAQADGVDASEYSFRLAIKLETGDERYAGVVNSGMWIGSGARKGAEGEFFSLLIFMILFSSSVDVREVREWILLIFWGIVIYDAYRVN
jgi:hypothetical protein